MIKTAFHITPEANLSAILSEGMKPMIGERSLELDEKVDAVYLFPTRLDAEDGLGSWLGDQFEDDEEMVILEVDITDLAFESEVGWEFKVLEYINPSRILNSKLI